MALRHKKRIEFAAKILIGILSFYFIYHRISTIDGFYETITQWSRQPRIYLTFLIVLFLMPVNWGIESFKWKLITQQVEKISLIKASQSVFSGICVGNIAPGRALEFAAKILFFKPENRPSVTVLHFVNGMFQMLITVLVGTISVLYKSSTGNQSTALFYAIILCGVCLIVVFCWCIINVKYIQQKLKFIKWFKKFEDIELKPFAKTLALKLISLSVIRYAVFTMQFYIIFQVLAPNHIFINSFTSIAVYFLLTSLIPMISVIEPAIRAAIALFVFNEPNGDLVIILSSTMLWIINVVVPSIIGYLVILKQKIVIR